MRRPGAQSLRTSWVLTLKTQMKKTKYRAQLLSPQSMISTIRTLQTLQASMSTSPLVSAHQRQQRTHHNKMTFTTLTPTTSLTPTTLISTCPTPSTALTPTQSTALGWTVQPRYRVSNRGSVRTRTRPWPRSNWHSWFSLVSPVRNH